MRIQEVIRTLNQMRREGVIEDYAVGEAVGATFYLEPIATIDIDVFVAFEVQSERLIVDPQPIFRYLESQGYKMNGEYVMIGGWPVQILAPSGPLVEEALAQATEVDVDGFSARVFSAEHLAAIALQTGRAKDKLRLLQFIEEGVLNMPRLQTILHRNELSDAWNRFLRQFFEGGNEF
jgi:hypothetical protein